VTRAGRSLRVLVTGATGFIGRNLIGRMPPDWDALALVRGAADLGGGVPTVTLPEAEGTLPEALAAGFDVIVHLAGNANHGLAESEPWRDLSATGLTAARVLGQIRARRVVLLSSAAVYAGLVGRVSPASHVEPRMAYALSKRYVEGLVDALVASGRLRSRIVLRLYNAFGPGERATRLIPRVAASASERGTFTLTGDPGSLSDPVHVDHVVAALTAAAASDVDGVFDLCGGDARPLRDQVGRIATALGFEPPAIEVVPRAGEVPIRFFSDPASLLSSLGIAGPEPFDVAVRRYGEVAGLVARHSPPS
jgi:nucleoside-diphosphate-sugar epimerase